MWAKETEWSLYLLTPYFYLLIPLIVLVLFILFIESTCEAFSLLLLSV